VPSEDWKKKTLGEAWYLGDTFNLGIGQGYMLVTPLEVNAWTSALANGGILYQPHLLFGKKKILGENLAEKKYIDLVREGMRQSCDTGGVAWPLFGFRVKYDPSSSIKFDGRDFVEEASGSAKYVRVSLGCKTGTAEVAKDKNPHAWITVFAPFYNPTVAVTVLVENGGEGSSVAGPIAKKILEEYFESL
jgi:penicillin-binding protein 2